MLSRALPEVKVDVMVELFDQFEKSRFTKSLGRKPTHASCERYNRCIVPELMLLLILTPSS